MADSLSMNKVLRAFLKADGFDMSSIGDGFDVHFDSDGDIIFNEGGDWWEIGSSGRWRELFMFTVRYVNEEWL